MFLDDLPAERRDVFYYRRYGTTAPETWYASEVTAIAPPSGSPSANVLRATPFICPKQITLDRIAISIITGVAGNARLGIYGDNGNLLPQTLLLDAGEVDVGSSGAKILTINQVLNSDTLYWLAHVANVAPNMRCLSGSNALPILGHPSALGATVYLYAGADYTYGVLPNPFPSPTYYSTTPVPLVYVRLSA